MPITELKILKYECKKCLHDWMMINPGKDSRSLEDNGYFCPYCGEKEGTEINVLPRFATDEEAGFTETRIAPSVVQKGEKTAVRLGAEDSMTRQQCPDGGWWNPITKKCQGEGVGHNLELDNDDQV